MKRLQLLLVAFALVCFTAIYACNQAPKEKECTSEEVEAVEETPADTTEAPAEEMPAEEEAPAETPAE